MEGDTTMAQVVTETCGWQGVLPTQGLFRYIEPGVTPERFPCVEGHSTKRVIDVLACDEEGLDLGALMDREHQEMRGAMIDELFELARDFPMSFSIAALCSFVVPGDAMHHRYVPVISGTPGNRSLLLGCLCKLGGVWGFHNPPSHIAVVRL